MGDLKSNDLDNGKTIPYANAYKLTIYSYGNKIDMSLDTSLNTPLGTLLDVIKLAKQNGMQWFRNEWITDANGKKKLNRQNATLDQVPQEVKV